MAGTQYRGSEIKDVDQFLKDSNYLCTNNPNIFWSKSEYFFSSAP